MKKKTRRDFIKKGAGATAGLTLVPNLLFSKQLIPDEKKGISTPNDIVKWLEEKNGWDLGHEEGIHHGSGDIEIKGVTVCWKASPQAIAEAGSRGDNLIIVHESLHYPYYFDFDPDRTPDWKDWKINTQRMARLDKNDQTVLRLHYSIDRLCIATDMAKWLDLGEPVEDIKEYKIYEIKECPLEELIAKVKKISGLPAIRVSSPKGLETRVKRIGLLVGGSALVPNGRAFEPGIRAGIDVFIAGETDNYGFRYASECGISLIETSHEASENLGFENFSKMIKEKFPDLRVTFYENKCPYEVM